MDTQKHFRKGLSFVSFEERNRRHGRYVRLIELLDGLPIVTPRWSASLLCIETQEYDGVIRRPGSAQDIYIYHGIYSARLLIIITLDFEERGNPRLHGLYVPLADWLVGFAIYDTRVSANLVNFRKKQKQRQCRREDDEYQNKYSMLS